jgi:thiol:disulfide interchange protein DsbA
MKMTRRLAGVALVLTAMLSGWASAEDKFREGEHYVLISPPVNVGASDEVIVNEFFWYGCGHCYSFEGMLRAWEGKLPDGVMFDATPAMWNGPMQLHAKAYYVAKALGVLDTLHEKIFEAMHLKRQRLSSKGQIRELFVANGVDGEAFDRAFDSFGINSQVRQAEASARGARISGTPSMMVNGKYRIEARMAGSQAGMLEVADFLIQKELAAAEKMEQSADD